LQQESGSYQQLFINCLVSDTLHTSNNLG